MNYKKGVLSVVLWLVYTMIVGTGAVGTVMTVLLPEGGSHPVGLVIAGVWLAVTGLAVFLLHRLFERILRQTNRDRQQAGIILEGVLLVVLIAAGIALRVREVMLYDMTSASGNIWFDTVKVTENTQIPQVVHGAVYLYLQVLHGLLVLLGNKMSAALILQVVLQILTGVVLYFAVRKLSGGVAALVAAGYGMLCPLLDTVVILGPEPLYLFLWLIGLWATAGALEYFQRKGNTPGIYSLIRFFTGGLVTGVLGYLDIMGFLLLLSAFFVIFLETNQKTGLLRRINALLLDLLGTLTGFFLCIALDAVSSGRFMKNVLLAWWKVCEPKNFSLAATYADNTGTNSTFSLIILAVSLTILIAGIFSYWCRKKWERLSVWVAVTIALVGMICYGMTTVEMQGVSLLGLLAASAAGAGAQGVLPCGAKKALVQNVTDQETEEKNMIPARRRIKIQDLETEELAEEETAPAAEERANKIQYIENPLPLPKKHVPKVLDYKLDSDAGDFDYPVAEDDDFDH